MLVIITDRLKTLSDKFYIFADVFWKKEMKITRILRIWVLWWCLAGGGERNVCSQQTNLGGLLSQGEVHGNFQIDAQYYQKDTVIGAIQAPEKMLSNGFANFIYTSRYIQAGLRYESYLNPIQGFPPQYQGSGIPYRYFTFQQEHFSFTAGNFYEQFGSGIILRAYESRGLGYDNALDGFRVKYTPYQGIYLKGLIGRQRKYFSLGQGIVRGVDGEINLNEVFDSLAGRKTHLILGGSFVSKYEQDQNSQLILPENVAVYGGRFNLIHDGFNLFAEYAYKINDPSQDNNYIYKPGEALLIQASYSAQGFGVSLGAIRNDNFSFRSERTAVLQEVLINYVPSLTRQHTYNLLATLYPYATQLNGQIGYQAEMIFRLKKGTPWGGKYGTTVLINYSQMNNLDTLHLNDWNTTRKGYRAEYFSQGSLYFSDFNIEISKKWTKKIKTTLTYANLIYNKDVLEGKSGYGNIYANVGVMDFTYRFNDRHSLRTELQGLFSHKDQGDWATGLVEYTYSPHWFVALLDQYNYGNKVVYKRVHYYTALLGYVRNTLRITLSYGRQRQGIFCVGGVCRNVPAANGVTLSITYSF